MTQPDTPLVFSVTEFVAVFNQTLEFAYPSVVIIGELANFKIVRNKWIYFDLKDEESSVRFFGTIYNLPGPLEDGLNLQVRAVPRLHPKFGFSLSVQQILPMGEGSIKRVALLLERKLASEGLFDEARKRPLLYPPTTIGLITSSESAAYHDFIKILNQRWGGVDIQLADVQVQGESAAGQIIEAVERFNQAAEPPEILVITRGGGSAEDLSAFNNEALVRAVAVSRIPTLIAIGHEVDLCLAEMAADKRASTPSNAAELLTPDKRQTSKQLAQTAQYLKTQLNNIIKTQTEQFQGSALKLEEMLHSIFLQAVERLKVHSDLLTALSPQAAMRRGYAVLYSKTALIKSVRMVKVNSIINARLHDGELSARVNSVKLK